MKTHSGAGRSLGVVILAITLSAAVGCGKQAETGPPPPPAVTVDQPMRRDVMLYDEHLGSTRAVESVEVKARVSGVLEKMSFQPSSFVEDGQLLFVIEPRLYKAERDAAVAALKSAEAHLARAESDLQRVEIAVKTDAVSQSDVDLARAERDMAEAQVLSAQAVLDQAELQYSYTQVRAPISGQVGRNLVDVGNIVSGQQGTVLTTINRITPIFVYFNVPEEVLIQALRSLNITLESVGREGAERHYAYAATLADEGYPYRGVIDYIANTVDADTGTIEVRARFDNEDLKLFPGLFIRIRVPMGEAPDAVLIDERGLGTDLGGRYVFVIGDDNLVEQRYVQLGAVQDDGMVHILEGLKGDETYIVNGMLRARPGMPVTPEPASDRTASAESSEVG